MKSTKLKKGFTLNDVPDEVVVVAFIQGSGQFVGSEVIKRIKEVQSKYPEWFTNEGRVTSENVFTETKD